MNGEDTLNPIPLDVSAVKGVVDGALVIVASPIEAAIVEGEVSEEDSGSCSEEESLDNSGLSEYEKLRLERIKQ
jgi:hypothetical protein